MCTLHHQKRIHFSSLFSFSSNTEEPHILTHVLTSPPLVLWWPQSSQNIAFTRMSKGDQMNYLPDVFISHTGVFLSVLIKSHMLCACIMPSELVVSNFVLGINSFSTTCLGKDWNKRQLLWWATLLTFICADFILGVGVHGQWILQLFSFFYFNILFVRQTMSLL